VSPVGRVRRVRLGCEEVTWRWERRCVPVRPAHGTVGWADGEQYNPNAAAEIPPRYEDSSRDRSVSVATSSQQDLYNNPFADPEPDYTPPVSPVSATATVVAERNIVADGGMRGVVV
jgi:hypothetical protein